MGGLRQLRLQSYPIGMSPLKKPANRKSSDDFVKSVTKALKQAAKEARRQAKIHGTKVWVMIDGKVVGLKP